MEWMLDLYSSDYWLSRYLLQRALGVAYLLAFVNALNQYRPLVGENGLLPVSRFINRVTFRQAPGIFHWHYSDRFFSIVAWLGIFLSVVALTGLSESGSLWVSMLIWFILWVLYQSIVNTGQIFWGYGWESMLLEAGFYAIFLGPLSMATPVIVIWLMRWMLFRVEFGAGLIKIRGDRCWRDLTCLNYHHETQPLPNLLSRYFHLLPGWIHKVETASNHFVQLVVVWGLFFPQPVASIAAGLIILSQLYLVISGNYSWLNLLTLSLGFSGFSDQVLQSIVGVTVPTVQAGPVIFQGILLLLCLMVVIMSFHPIKNMISRHQQMNASFNPLHLVNTYGAFGSVTKKRHEIVIEGTSEKNITDDTEWKAYEFKGKPGNTYRRSPQVAPYHLRLDWQMWFAALRPYQPPLWIQRLIEKLLKNDSALLRLFKRNPFPDKRPAHIRALLYRYRYATRKERKDSGKWWIRELKGVYFEPVSLSDKA